ncbi:hypothetical protein PUR71_15105 [Streptomyces sp. SP17BM10]|uniref:hypothetical protein n=1 Tax=Streptomyces sp. SP17BM10 TaxID=3002530 RepID=UPI002E784666|nr:hypothetical protein [Streptomyces sp. SP17BM10]MEE1784215.1 hypothetical protein [Streptomyces sp. SP17BM10]
MNRPRPADVLTAALLVTGTALVAAGAALALSHAAEHAVSSGALLAVWVHVLLVHARVAHPAAA